MRKLLLATAAVLGVTWGGAGAVYAQALPKSPKPTPGNIVVRLNGKLRFFASAIFGSDANSGLTKQNEYGFGSYVRLYPGFDGVAANGLKYGVSTEIRQENNNGGANASTTSSGLSGQAPSNGGLYFRRAWGYIGTDQAGTIRVGSTDGPDTLFLTGTFEDFNDGGWNGDVPQQIPGSLAPTWPFSDVGNGYVGERIVYLSPSIAGFEFGASFMPNAVGLSMGGGSAYLASSPIPSEYYRQKNQIQVAVRYRGSFGPVGIAADAGYTTSGHVNASAVPPGGPANPEGLNVGDGGVALTFAGLTVGGHYQRGRFNGSWGLVPSGAADGEAWVVGATYEMGPAIVGASWFDYKSEGSLASTSQRREQGLAAGATYSLAPGVALFADYLYGKRYEGGVNLVGGGPATAHNHVQVQTFSIGTGFTW